MHSALAELVRVCERPCGSGRVVTRRGAAGGTVRSVLRSDRARAVVPQLAASRAASVSGSAVTRAILNRTPTAEAVEACSHASTGVLRIKASVAALGVGTTLVGIATHIGRVIASGEVVPLLQIPVGVACLEHHCLHRVLTRAHLENTSGLDQLDPGFSRILELVGRLVGDSWPGQVLGFSQRLRRHRRE